MRGRIRWRLFAVVMVSGLVASAALFLALAQGALAASFLISNQQSKESAERVEGTGVIQYGAFDRRYEGEIVPVLVLGLKQSKIMGFCQSTVVRDIPLIGTFTVKVTARQVTAYDTYRDVVQEDNGTVTLKDTNSGIAAGASRKGPGINEGDNTDPASSAQEADSILVTDSKQIVLATSARIARVSGRSVRFYKGVHECF
ncbi:DUF6230 family protein [Streptomyces sp. NPDC005500]|uniref:DUF6230 family protein n=1 Tax=Streptomyces sp. NPDC005500 TaxID=3155007 RepID=UPI0033AB1BCE